MAATVVCIFYILPQTTRKQWALFNPASFITLGPPATIETMTVNSWSDVHVQCSAYIKKMKEYQKSFRVTGSQWLNVKYVKYSRHLESGSVVDHGKVEYPVYCSSPSPPSIPNFTKQHEKTVNYLHFKNKKFKIAERNAKKHFKKRGIPWDPITFAKNRQEQELKVEQRLKLEANKKAMELSASKKAMVIAKAEAREHLSKNERESSNKEKRELFNKKIDDLHNAYHQGGAARWRT
jgi:hypothetical protein